MNNLEILKISCCGANEFNDINEIIKFLKKNPRAEIGIGVSNQSTAHSRIRYNWIAHLFQTLKENSINGQTALHVNKLWSKIVAINGVLPLDLIELINNAPRDLRLQINFVGSGYACEAKKPEKLLKLINKCNKVKFILPYSPISANFITSLREKTNNFDVLYDQSYGSGTLAQSYQSVFENTLQGYAGGFSPENIQKELGKICSTQKKKTGIWIDAEGKLRQDNCNALDLNKAQDFINNIVSWENSVNKKCIDMLIK